MTRKIPAVLLAALLAVAAGGGMTRAQEKKPDGKMAAAETKAGFDVLGGFPFTPPAYDPERPDEPAGPRVDEQIPSAVRKLNGRRVIITGYMLPTRMDAGRVLEFLLLRDQAMCCFGAQPQMNEWVVVRMEKPGEYLPDTPRSFSGVLKIGAHVENGCLGGIYLLDGARAAK